MGDTDDPLLPSLCLLWFSENQGDHGQQEEGGTSHCELLQLFVCVRARALNFVAGGSTLHLPLPASQMLLDKGFVLSSPTLTQLILKINSRPLSMYTITGPGVYTFNVYVCVHVLCVSVSCVH